MAPLSITCLKQPSLLSLYSKKDEAGDQVLSEQDHMVQDTLSTMSGVDFNLKESSSLILQSGEVCESRTILLVHISSHLSHSSGFCFLFLIRMALSSVAHQSRLDSGYLKYMQCINVLFFSLQRSILGLLGYSLQSAGASCSLVSITINAFEVRPQNCLYHYSVSYIPY